MQIKINSLRTRLSLYVLLVSTIVFVVITCIIEYNISKDMEAKAIQYASLMQQNMKGHTEAQMKAVEVSVQRMEPYLRKNIHNPDSLMGVVRLLMTLDTNIEGAGIVMRPDYYPGRHLVMEFIHRERDGQLRPYHMGDIPGYDYTERPWYSQAAANPKGSWSEPFKAINVQDYKTFISHYALPILDKEGKMMALFIANLNIEGIKEEFGLLKGYEGSFSFVLSEQGRYVVHPESANRRGVSYIERAERIDQPSLINVGAAMTAGESGYQITGKGSQKRIVLYAPLSNSGWSVAAVIPYDTAIGSIFDTGKLIIGIMLLGLVLLTIISYILLKRSLAPLDELRHSIGEIAEGNFSVDLPVVKTGDEIEQMRNACNRLQRDLKQYTNDLTTRTKEKQAIESELYVARNIQMRLTPEPFEGKKYDCELDLDAFLQPAREAGGNFYDYFVRGRLLYFAVGDVSDRGVPASILTTITRTLFRVGAEHTDKVESILNNVNRGVVMDNEFDMFVTMICGVLNLDTGQLQICSAGHQPPFIRHADGSVEAMQIEPNMALGVIDNFNFQSQSITLKPNTALLFFTDGLTEVANLGGRPLGQKPVHETMRKDNGKGCHQLLQDLYDLVRRHTDGTTPTDDLTMLAMRWGSAPKEAPVVKKTAKAPQEVLHMKNNAESVTLLAPFIGNYCQRHNVGEEQVFGLNLALEEVVVNVVNYAYPGLSERPIRVTLEIKREQLIAEVTDEGMPFNPLTDSPKADTTSSAEKRAIGGLGVLLANELMDKVSYERKNGQNILTLVKKL